MAEAQECRGSQAPIIYVVDDEEALSRLVELSLAKGPWRIKRFDKPKRCLQDLMQEEEKPVLLVTDFKMPGMTGLELAAQCKKHHPALKVVLMSGTAGPEVMNEAPIKVDRFLPKPFTSRKILEVVRSLLPE